MGSAFEFTTIVKNLLFEGISFSSVGAFLLACLVFAFIAGVYEIIRFLREYLLYQMNKSCCDPAPAETSRLWPRNQTITRTVKIQIHCSQTFLHVFQVLFGYVLMLCVMKFNAWFFIVIVLVMGCGHFLLGAILPKQFDIPSDSCATSDLRAHEHRSYSSINKEDELPTAQQ